MFACGPAAAKLLPITSRHGHKKTGHHPLSRTMTLCLPNMTGLVVSSRCRTGHIPSKRCRFSRTRAIPDGPARAAKLGCSGYSHEIHPPPSRPRRAASGDNWWSQSGSNRRPDACKATALPAELWPQFWQMRTDRPYAWWAWDDSNVRPHPYQGCALTT